MRHYSAIIIAAFLFSAVTFAGAQTVAEQPDSTAVTGIVDAINTREGGTVTVIQPEGLDARMKASSSMAETSAADQAVTARQSTRRAGYRVQVYSDNNVTTAKANAEYRRKVIQQRIPGVHAYISFESPYWRVRVGDYRTQAEAQAAMQEIQGAFPAFAGDCRIVRERINN